MLSWEFYALNTTTFLLWLFQNCPHEVLTLIFALGAVCLLELSICTVFRVVYAFIRVIFFLFDIVPQLVLSFFKPPRRSRHTSRSLTADSNLPVADRATSSVLAARGNVPTVSLDRPHPPHVDSELTLPQSLALYPEQWSEIEVSRARANSSEFAQPPAASTRPLLRRSRRGQRARIAISP